MGNDDAGMIPVEPNTIVVFSDIACPWAHLCVYRLLTTRSRLGLDDAVALDHHVFALELFNRRATPCSQLDGEIPAIGGLAPDCGWQMWQGPTNTWPVTVLLAAEAVQAAKEQSLRASERLDRALRLAFFAESRCISLHHVVVEVAEETVGVDADQIDDALASGRYRSRIFEDFETARAGHVKGSPHLFLPDGSDHLNPGIDKYMSKEHGGFPVITRDEPSVYEEIVKAAAAQTPSST